MRSSLIQAALPSVLLTQVGEEDGLDTAVPHLPAEG
jgi:hypothetical protein